MTLDYLSDIGIDKVFESTSVLSWEYQPIEYFDKFNKFNPLNHSDKSFF